MASNNWLESCCCSRISSDSSSGVFSISERPIILRLSGIDRHWCPGDIIAMDNWSSSRVCAHRAGSLTAIRKSDWRCCSDMLLARHVSSLCDIRISDTVQSSRNCFWLELVCWGNPLNNLISACLWKRVCITNPQTFEHLLNYFFGLFIVNRMFVQGASGTSQAACWAKLFFRKCNSDLI